MLFLFTLFFLSTTLHAKENFAPLHPYKTENSPFIDGKLDDAIWQKAPYVSGFKTWVPDYGMDMAEATEVYVAYDR